MNKPIVSLVAAIGKNRELGRNNTLLWNIPEDMKHFRDVTKGHVVVMGRKTYESIGRLLPNRINIIVTRDNSFSVEGAIVCHSLEEAIVEAKKHEKEEIMVIGGGQIYEQAIKVADRLYLTVIDSSFSADTYFPIYSNFKKIISEKKSKDNNYTYTFLTLEK